LDAAPAAPVLVDCLTLWLSNLMLAEADTEAATVALEAALARRTAPTVLVSNEVGSGIVPATSLGRRFRDAQGRLNQRVAAMAERVELVVAGLPLRIR
jgi:adenosylcobinamide kinase/adenosylcobinamide-phosphate guanylyltransferase